MSDQVLIAVVSGVIAGVVSLVVAVITQRGNTAQATVESKASPYQALADRVIKLETQVGQLRSELEHTQDDVQILQDNNRALRASLAHLETAINRDDTQAAKAIIRQMVSQLDATDKATRRRT